MVSFKQQKHSYGDLQLNFEQHLDSTATLMRTKHKAEVRLKGMSTVLQVFNH